MILRPNRLPVKWHGLIDCETSLMDDNVGPMFIRLNIMDMQNSIPEGMEKDIGEQSLPYKILNKRLEAMGSADEISFPVKCFCAMLCENPGKAVMWAYTLHYIRVADGFKVNMSQLAEWFPDGFPTEESMSKAWDAQKMATIAPEVKRTFPAPDNWVDYPENWPKLKEGP